MFFVAANDHKFRLDRSIYVGDDIRDALAAENAGCKYLLVSPEELYGESDTSVASVGTSLLDLVPTIIERYEIWEKLTL